MNRLKSHKSGNLLLGKIILYISSSTAATRFFQQPTYPTTGEFSQKLLPTIRFQWSAFVEIECFFPLQETMYNNNKSVLSPYDPTKLASILFCVQKTILNEIVVRLSERRFLLMTLCNSLTRRTS